MCPLLTSVAPVISGIILTLNRAVALLDPGEVPTTNFNGVASVSPEQLPTNVHEVDPAIDVNRPPAGLVVVNPAVEVERDVPVTGVGDLPNSLVIEEDGSLAANNGVLKGCDIGKRL